MPPLAEVEMGHRNSKDENDQSLCSSADDDSVGIELNVDQGDV